MSSPRQIFRGRTLGQAKEAAERALGMDAVVLTARHVRRPGLAGMLGTTEVEVVAAARDPEPMEPPPPPPTPSVRPQSNVFASGAYADRTAEGASPVATLRAELRAELRSLKNTAQQTARTGPDILAEIVALRTAIQDATPSLRLGDDAAAILRRQGIDGPTAALISRWFEAPEEQQQLVERLRDAVSEVLKVATWPIAAADRAVIALTGPSGVGKTTTLAKLAAHATMAHRSVTLVTCDGYRVGAVEQLQRYATLLGAQFAVASSADELSDILDEAETDLVFVDTSGRSPRSDGAEALLSAREFGDRGFARHVLLCLPAALRAQDASRTLDAYGAIDPTALVITKTDETVAPSGLVHGPALSGLPVTAVCAGQDVPEHIAQATVAGILDQIFPRAASRGAAS